MTKYYLQDTSYYHGNYMNWWAKDCKGYTANLDKAHQFTAQEIADMADRGMRATDIPWLCEYVDEQSARCANASYCNYDKMKEMKRTILPSKPNKGGWISIDNELPPRDSEILVFNNNTEHFRDVRLVHFNSDFYFAFLNGNLGVKSFTHWQPLPEPPPPTTRMATLTIPHNNS